MPAIERKIPGTYSKVPGGYTQEIDEQTTLFVPDACVASFDPKTGELHGYAPDYAALEAAKAPAVEAAKPGEYAYHSEDQHAPIGCDFAASLGFYGEHYYLRPLRDDPPQLHGRGITPVEHGWYRVTKRAYERLKAQYKISYEMCYD